MKRVGIIISSLFIIILLQSIVNAETYINSMLKIKDKLLQVDRDLGDFLDVENSPSSEHECAILIHSGMIELLNHILHLYDMLTIKDIIPNKDESNFVRSKIDTHIKHMSETLNNNIVYLNKVMSLSKRPSLVSIANQVINEYYKLQKLLKNIEQENKVAASLTGTFAVTAAAVAMTGSELKAAHEFDFCWYVRGTLCAILRRSETPEHPPEAYIRGFFDAGDSLVFGSLSESEVIACPRPGVTDRQICDVVRKYLKDHPEELHLNAAILIDKVLRMAWPCKQ
ncbi:MAG: Rap1a/Tai family immunity protein [Syntrophobacteraceae bacterium]